MALTKNYQLLSSNNYTVVGNNSLRLYGKYNSQNTTGNYTNVTLQLRTIALSGYFTSSGNTSTLTCNGANRGTQSYNIGTVTTSAETVIGTWTFDIGHNSDGKKTGVSFSASANVYGNLNPSTSGSFDLPSIARQANITNANNFTDEENAYFTFNNPGGFTIDMWLEPSPVNTHYPRKNIPNTGNYTFEFTEEERKEFRKVASNANSITVRYGLYTYIGNTTYTSYIDRTMTIVNANPTFNSFNFEDINEKTLALTGNNQNIIQNYSNVKVTIPTEFIAIANKEATMNKYRFACGDSSVDIAYSGSENASGVINNIKNGIFNVYAIDSRNNSTLITKNAEHVISYNPLLKKNISVGRQNGVSENVNLKFNGTIDLVNFGLKQNSILNAKYRYMVTGTNTWSDYQDINVTVSETGEFTFDALIKGDTEEAGFNINNSYNIEVFVEDELSSITYTATFGSGIPNIALHKNGVGIMGKYDVDEGGLLQVAGKNILGKFNEVIWEGTLLGGFEIDVDLSDCDRVRIYSNIYYANCVFEIDLTKVPITYDGYAYSGGGTVRTTDMGNSYYSCICLVNSAKTKLKVLAIGYENNGSWTDRNNNTSYYVYKVEKVGSTEITHNHTFESNEVYTENEQIIGTWIDGKTLYRKVIIIGDVSTSEIKTPIEVPEIDKVVSLTGGGYMTSNNNFLPWNFENAGGFSSCYYDAPAQKLTSIVSTANYKLYNSFGIIKYTKITD